MTRNWIAATVVLATMATVGWAQKNEPVTPKSGPPTFAFVYDLDKSQNLVYVQTIEFVPREETRMVVETIDENGRKFQVTRQVKVYVYVPVSRVTKWDAEKGAAINGAGKKLTREDLFQQLRAGDSILIYSGEVDPMFLKPLKENTILLQMETPPTVIAPMKVPEPIPAPKK
jgi:hypothetical protein